MGHQNVGTHNAGAVACAVHDWGLAIAAVPQRLIYSIDHLADRGLLRLGVKQFQFVLSKRLSQDIHGHLN